MKRTVVVLAMFVGVLAGCTFLVTFDDVPKDDAALTVPDARTRPIEHVDTGSPVVERDTGSTPPPVVEAGAGDATVDYSTACMGRPDGKYCNGNKIVVDAGSKDDLITCVGGTTASARLCANGCQRMPTGFPDECDECSGKATGLYCGDDFNGWHPDNRNTRIRCDNGAIVGNLICSNGCTGTGPTAGCVQ